MRQRVGAVGWDACVVVNEQRVVFGLLRAAELKRDPALRIEQAMRPGPSTYRPYVATEKLAKVMAEHGRESLLVTTSDGRLVGLVKRSDVSAEAVEPA